MNIINILLLSAFAIISAVALPGTALNGIQPRNELWPHVARYFLPIGPGGEMKGVGIAGDDDVSTIIPLIPSAHNLGHILLN